jgi:hypothetical protein
MSAGEIVKPSLLTLVYSIQLFQDARATLKRISGSSAPFTMLSPPNEALGQRRSAYYHLVKVVEKYAELFTEDRHKCEIVQIMYVVNVI